MSRLLLVIIFSSLLITAACEPKKEAPPLKEQTLVVGLAKGPQTLDPRQDTDAASFRVIQVLFNGLVRKGPNMTLLPDLAERWEMTDERTWKFFLKKGVKFHNGREMTAQDVAYTFESILDPALKSPKRQNLSAVDRIKIEDPYTIIFHTKEPFAPLLVNLTVGVIPAVEAKAAGDDFAEKPIGTGPYKFVGQRADQEVELVAFNGHFKGDPKIKHLKFRIVQDDTTRYLELIKGHLDFVQNAITSDMVPVLANKEEFKVIKSEGTNYEYLAFNLDDPILKRREVRQAMAQAINIPDMIAFLFRGLASPATGLLPPSHWAYEPQVEYYPYNPSQANQILDKAGLPKKDDGFRFHLTYKTSLSEPAKLKAEILQQAFKDIGIKLNIRGYDWGTLFADIKNGSFQLYSLQWVGASDPDIYYYLFSSECLPPQGANRGRYLNPLMDALLIAGRQTMDMSLRKKIYSDVQKILAFDLPYISLWHPANIVIMKKNLDGFEPYPDGDLSGLYKIRWKARIK